MSVKKTAACPALKRLTFFSLIRKGVGVAGMPWGVLELLPDECALPNMATKARKPPRQSPSEGDVPVVVAQSSSATSLSSGSSTLSKTSKTSQASSRCSFPPLRRTAGITKGRVRVAIMGSATGGTAAGASV